MSERIIRREADGRWLVLTPEGLFVSVYDRRDDALARATTGLKQIGGGCWTLIDAHGNELDRGEVSGALDAPRFVAQ
jgi:hypothetical protein